MLERIAGSLRQMLDPVGGLHPAIEHRRISLGAGDQCFEAAGPFRPIEREQPVFDAQHRGRVDRLATEDAIDELAAFRQAEDFRQRARRRFGFKPLDGARAEHEHAVRRLSAERLLPAEGADIDLRPVDVLRERSRSGVADGEAGPLARDPGGVRNPHSAGGAVPGEDDVASRINARQIRDLAVIRGPDFGVELELLGNVGDPAGAEALPRQHRYGPGAEQRPDRHLHRASIGRRDDSEPVVGRQLQQRMRAVDRFGEERPADLPRWERPSARVPSRSGRQPGGLAHGPDEK